MNEGNPYANVPLTMLKDLRGKKVATIERERHELEQIELIIRSMERPQGAVLKPEDQRQLLTSGGNIRNLAQWAAKILEAYGHVMTASEIAEAMYSYAWTIDLRSFKRRVIVAVSAVANLDEAKGEVRFIVLSGTKATNREVRWALPNWMREGTLLPQYGPKEEQMTTQ